MSHGLGDKNGGSRGSGGRRAGALRLFGALSGAEEEYLAACEREGGAGTAAMSGMTRLIHRYGRAAAAALCVAVLGVSYLSFRLGVFPNGSKDFDGASSGGGINSQNTADCAMPQAGEPEEVGGPEAAGAAAAKKRDEAESMQMDAMDSGAEGEKRAEQGEIQDNSVEMLQESRNDLPSQENGQTAQGSTTDNSAESSVKEDMSGVPVDSRIEMTLEEAGALAVVGAYLPASWPSDGSIESVRGSDRAGEENVALTWTYSNRWDSFTLTVDNLGTDLPVWVQDTLADVSKPETYDENLYEIPYADTVPSGYHLVFQNPVFREDDFTRECVAARILPNVGDSGDTGTPRGNFRVLYQTDEGSYVLVGFSGRGTVDVVWNLIHSIHQSTQYEPWQKPPAP